MALQRLRWGHWFRCVWPRATLAKAALRQVINNSIKSNSYNEFAHARRVHLFTSTTAMPLDSATPAAASATWIALAPHDMAHGSWRVVDSAGKSDTYTSGTLAAAVSHRGRTGNDTSVCASICVIAPLSRYIVMATDLPLLTGPRLQLALTGALGDRLSNSGVQHYAAAPVENGRIREAAVCDAQWLRQCLGALAESGVRVARVVPEAALLPKGSAWWGQLQADQPPAWLVRAASGDRKSTRLNSSHSQQSRMPSSA